MQAKKVLIMLFPLVLAGCAGIDKHEFDDLSYKGYERIGINSEMAVFMGKTPYQRAGNRLTVHFIYAFRDPQKLGTTFYTTSINQVEITCGSKSAKTTVTKFFRDRDVKEQVGKAKKGFELALSDASAFDAARQAFCKGKK